MNSLPIIQQWLFEKHIKVNKEWIEACLKWLLEQLASPSVQDLKNGVYKQWITEDLCEMGCQSLPANINNIRKIMLTGKYILQINSLRDISQPAYSQLVKSGSDTVQENHLVSAAPKEPEPPWKAKPKRMLYMEVTDGKVELHAMEYKSIGHLDLNTKPGTKILVTGPLEYRMGVLFLTNSNVQVLGGHVESLVTANTQENVLKKALGDRNEASGDVPDQSSNNLRRQNMNVPDEEASARSNCNLSSSAHEIRNESSSWKKSDSLKQSRRVISGNSAGHKRSHSITIESDSQGEDDNDAYFDDVDMDMLIATSQAVEERAFAAPQQPMNRNQVIPPAVTSEDDFYADEKMFEEEMKNVLASVDDNFEPARSSPFRKQNTPSTDSLQIDWKSPYRYLSTVNTNSLPTDPKEAEHIIIKGFISTVTSQLKPHPTLGWQLTAKVNDGSKSLEVDLCDSVLAELIGLTVKDVIKMRSQARLNPEVNTKIMKSVDQCQKSLLNMNGLMELILVSPRPCLLRHLPFDGHHLKSLVDRVIMASNRS